jgi:hypothetical protein
MLTLVIDQEEFFNEETQQFELVGGLELELEHSLVSLSKWESKVKKPFLSKDEKTPEEIMHYVEAMIISPIFPRGIVARLTQEHITTVQRYIESTESATTFGTMPETKGRGETITSELIYYWMVAFNIPFETERWHLNRLFALIRICNLKNSKPKKMTKAELMARNRRINAERKEKYGTSG